jgi:hypothetical protein
VIILAKKKGEKYKCDEYGMAVLVEDVCSCEDCDIVCCSTPMKQVKEEKLKSKVKPKKQDSNNSFSCLTLISINSEFLLPLPNYGLRVPGSLTQRRSEKRFFGDYRR